MSDEAYKVDELARAAGTSPRTVRYYVQRGLLPAPAFRGKDTAYGREHLVRLRAIRQLQNAFFPLDAIAVELERRTIAELERIADGTDLPGAAQPAPAADVGGGPYRQIAHRPASLHERTFRRIELAPGVELCIANDAPRASHDLAQRIMKELET